MISAKEAKEIILSNTQNWGHEVVKIENAVNRVLQEDIYADRDFPPFDRVTMDGIAINTSDFENGIREFVISEMQTAGEKSKSISQKGHAIEIMTGAILCNNADANIRYEDLDIIEIEGVRIAKVNIEKVAKWQNIHKKGKDGLVGDLLIEKCKCLESSDIAVLATVGKSNVLVSKLPSVAIISTGDELVPVDQIPASHQIRMSNSISMQSKLNSLGVQNKLFHLLDDYGSLLTKVNEIIEQFDVVILSGGVSKGKADYIPDVLNELGVNKFFHRVAQRPGKPFWFGKNGDQKCVFALPGNPVSTYMCFAIYFLPWLEKSTNTFSQKSYRAIIADDYSFKPNLTYYLQVKAEIDDSGKLIATPITGGGSGDLTNLLKANAFLELPANTTIFKAGDVFPLFPFSYL